MEELSFSYSIVFRGVGLGRSAMQTLGFDTECLMSVPRPKLVHGVIHDMSPKQFLSLTTAPGLLIAIKGCHYLMGGLKPNGAFTARPCC
jgi:hypothetical protein